MTSPLVLVVDDDADTRELYRLFFEVGQYRVAEADSMERAIEVARDVRPDVILTDWRLGDGDGLALCDALHRHGRTRRIPVVAATGMSLPVETRTRARQLGCESFLTKPVDLDLLMRVIASTLELHQARMLRAGAVRLRRFAVRARKSATAFAAVRTVTGADLLAASQARVDASVALIIADDAGHYVAVNDRAAELTGYESDVLTTLSVADLTPEPQLPTGERLWSSFMSTGTQEGVYLLKRRDGLAIPMRYVAIANIAPGLHLSALSPAQGPTPAATRDSIATLSLQA
jgi:chemotaxis family two-component system response regulator PixH